MDALADAGAIVHGTDLERQYMGIFGSGDVPWGFGGDITDPAFAQNLVHRLNLYTERRRTILVNNAGVDSRPGGDDTPDSMLAVNVQGTEQMTRIFGEAMAETGGGAIVNIASLYGLTVPDLRYYDHRDDGWVKTPYYGATKAGVINLTQYYAAKFGPSGVRVNALAPGGVVSDTDALTASDPAFAQKYTARIPMGRMCRPEDLAGPLVFLASEASSFVTGQTIAIDGGYTCW